MQPFFIAGLPRSRTAWVANFLTHDECFCYHEPLGCGLVRTIAGYPTLLADTKALYAGVACSGNALFYEDLYKLFPDARWVAIRRPLAESRESMLALGFPLGGAGRILETALESLIKRPNVLTIQYQAFNAARIWDHCTHGMAVNTRRLEMLERLHVVVRPDRMRQEVHDGLSTLTPEVLKCLP